MRIVEEARGRARQEQVEAGARGKGGGRGREAVCICGGRGGGGIFPSCLPHTTCTLTYTCLCGATMNAAMRC